MEVFYERKNSGTNPAENPQTYTIESPALTLAAPERPDCEFDGWYDNPAFTGSAVTGIPTGSTEDQTFYAKWKYLVQIAVSLAAPAGPKLPNSYSLYVSQSAVFSAADREYVSWTWYWDGAVISGENSDSYTLKGDSRSPGAYELLVVVTTRSGEKLSARCPVIIKG
jgi:uncharacterized repeat protein (TIGR02543 family)